MKVVVLTGNIGCGKSSTITNILCQLEYDTSITATGLLENVDDWKWLLEKFYNDKSKYVYLLQTIIFTHFIRMSEQIEKLRDSKFPPDVVIVERSPLDAKNIFIENIKHLMTDEEYASLQVTADKVINMYPWNDATYYKLDVPVETCHERTNRRKRPGEDKISLDYLLSLDALYKTFPATSILIDPTKHIAMVGDIVREVIMKPPPQPSAQS